MFPTSIAMSFTDSAEQQLINEKMEAWLTDKLNGGAAAAAVVDVSAFTNYIVSALGEEENSDEEKMDSIRPIIQELNQVGVVLLGYSNHHAYIFKHANIFCN